MLGLFSRRSDTHEKSFRKETRISLSLSIGGDASLPSLIHSQIALRSDFPIFPSAGPEAMAPGNVK